MAECSILLLAVLGLFITNAYGYVEIRQPEDKIIRNRRYYYLTGNFTVPAARPNGTFTIEEMEIRGKTWLVVYEQPDASSRQSSRPCQGFDLGHIRSNALKVYTNQTTVTSEDPDTFRVKPNTVLCFVVFLRDTTGGRWGGFKFSYEDGERKGGSRIRNYAGGEFEFKSRTIVEYHRRVCYDAGLENSTIAIDYTKKMTNRTSFEKVGMDAWKTEKVKECGTGPYGRKNVCKTFTDIRYKYLRTVSAQTPQHFYKWPLIVPDSDRVCFSFDTLSDMHQEAEFKISEFPTTSGMVRDSSAGVIASPGYPTAYPKGLNSLWTIMALPGQTLALEFEDAESDCGNDYVLLSGVVGGTKVLCGPALSGQRFRTTTNVFGMRFETNVFSQQRGFLMRYEAIGCSRQNLTFPPNSVLLTTRNLEAINPGDKLTVGCSAGYSFASKQSEVNVTCLAGGSWQGGIPFCIAYPSCTDTLDSEPSGSLTSPGYPGFYPKNASCQWTIMAKPGQRINVRLNNVRSDCENDYIMLGWVAPIKGGSSQTRSPRKILLCGRNATPGLVYTSYSTSLTVWFQSNIHEPHGYFDMAYKATGCSSDGIRVPDSTKFLNSDTYYPTGYGLKVQCLPGMRFPIPRKVVTLSCLANGKWRGRVPLCINAQNVTNINWS